MGNKQGRFGKYGETKRLERLRSGRPRKDKLSGAGRNPFAEREKLRRGDVFGISGVTVRRADPLDADYIKNLSGKVFREFGPYERLLPEWFKSDVVVTLLALADKRHVGFAMLGVPVQEMPPEYCELLAIAVEPSRQRAGIGDLLMREIEKKTRGMPVKRLVLHTAIDNVAGRKLFEKHGFLALKVKKSFYPGGQDAIMMCKDL